MTLRAKFGVLLTLLTVVVGVVLSTSLMYGALLQRELVWPFERTSGVLARLNNLRREIEDQRSLLDEPFVETQLVESDSVQPALHGPQWDARSRFEALQERVDAGIADLQQESGWTTRGASSVARNLYRRLREVETESLNWFSTGDVSMREQARDGFNQISELIERIVSQRIASGALAVDYTHRLRRIHVAMIAAGMAVVVLSGVLAYMLHLRWVLQPIRQLRLAAEQIARGNFEHRVPVLSADEMGLLTREVNDMAGTISAMQSEAVDRERLAAVGEMVRRLAHNIRNPLAGIRSLAELTKQRLAINPASAVDDQDKIIAAVDRFNGWLGDLLRATSALTIEPRATAVGPWLTGIASALEPLALMRGVKITRDFVGAPSEATFDSHHLEHAVVAILTNALQATPEGGEVKLVGRATNDATKWHILVEDTGPGVPPELIEKIFRPYFTTKRDGHGIGLAVAHQIVRAHDGSITVQSQPGQGATFIIELPLACGHADRLITTSVLADNSQKEAAFSGKDSGHRGRGQPSFLHTTEPGTPGPLRG